MGIVTNCKITEEKAMKNFLQLNTTVASWAADRWTKTVCSCLFTEQLNDTEFNTAISKYIYLECANEGLLQKKTGCHIMSPLPVGEI